MDWLTSILFLVAGVIIGFFVAKFLFEPKVKSDDQQQSEKTEKQMMAEQANLHINETQLAVQKIQEQCASLAEQLNHYQGVVEETSRDKDANQLEYYGQQAALHLKTKKSSASVKRAATDYQPLDYSEGNSGIFEDTKAPETHSETTQN